MADRRGGYQKPGNQNPGPSGPGRMSKRTDATKQYEREISRRRPSLDTPGVQYGDVGKIEASKRIAPPASANDMRGAPVEPRPAGSKLTRGGQLNPQLFERPTDHPDEPLTAGLDMGAGPGSEALAIHEPQDTRSMVLSYLSRNFGNKDAADMLAEYQRGPAQGAPTTAPMGPPAPEVAEEPTGPTEVGSDLEQVLPHEEATLGTEPPADEEFAPDEDDTEPV